MVHQAKEMERARTGREGPHPPVGPSLQISVQKLQGKEGPSTTPGNANSLGHHCLVLLSRARPARSQPPEGHRLHLMPLAGGILWGELAYLWKG